MLCYTSNKFFKDVILLISKLVSLYTVVAGIIGGVMGLIIICQSVYSDSYPTHQNSEEVSYYNIKCVVFR